MASSSSSPNILLIMTDQERYPPPYEGEAVAKFRKEQFPARESLRDGGLEFHRHYAGSTACTPSRATLFTGQYPSLHGVSQTDGLAKHHDDPSMMWLDPDAVPTLGDYFRAGGYQTHYRGKWHVSLADLLIPGTHEGLMASDEDGNPIPAVVDAYRKADRLDPFGFSGWVGREPHGATRAECGLVRDGVFADQVIELFDELAQARDDGPWLAVSSFVNPHDIAAFGVMADEVWKLPPPDDSVPEIPEAPSQSDSFAGRPKCQEQWTELWGQIIYPQPVNVDYRRLYYSLHKLVDAAVARILAALDASGMADDTIVVFTSDHGEMLGAHGGMQQKWCSAYDEAIRVPLVIKGPGVSTNGVGVDTPTSHVDLIPTLLGLAGIDADRAAAGAAEHHSEAQPLSGRDLSGLIAGSAPPDSIESPVYFMTEDDVSRGLTTTNIISGEPYVSAVAPCFIESTIATLPTATDGTGELWKLNHYYERLDEWNEARGIPTNPFAPTAAEAVFELHNLTADPEERTNLANDTKAKNALSTMQKVLDTQRDAKRRLPALRNPG
ncbi:MAG: sulfatase-like hydrolase/transferase [Acidimicrobiia bacterium]